MWMCVGDVKTEQQQEKCRGTKHVFETRKALAKSPLPSAGSTSGLGPASPPPGHDALHHIKKLPGAVGPVAVRPVSAAAPAAGGPCPLPAPRQSPPERRCLGVCGKVGLVRHPKTPHPTFDTSGMNLEPGECGMNSVSCGNGKLRQWLIDQIDSGKYPGLVWENDEKSIFRIPWKHAGKQDYNREEDAALFKAWALFKGKFREGIDKPDPPTWKTRLRCALNKSNDFEELVERSQLDISDPYKVYRIVPEGAKKGAKQISMEEQPLMMNHPFPITSPYTSLPSQVPNYMVPHERNWREFAPEQPHPDIPYQCTSVPFAARSHHWQGPGCENGCQVTGTFYACAPPESQTPGIPIEPSIRSGEALALSDCRLHICLYYREILVKEVTTSSPEGCRISHGQSYEVSSLEQVIFPYPEDNGQRKNIEKLLNHLERGVILWMAPDGLYAKRLCQSRIYWDGPLALCSDRPNKLERDQTCKLFDTQQFLAELQAFAHHGRPLPRYQVALCFGEEFPDPQRQRKLITAHVEPMFARQLYYFAQQNSGHLLRGYDLPELVTSPEDYHRSIRHSSIQE